MALISELKTIVTADATQFTRSMDAAAAKSKSFGTITTGSLFAVTAGITAAVGAALAMVEGIDAINDGAIQLGITTKAFQQLSYAAKLGDSSIESVSMGMKKLNKAVFDAADGNKNLSETFAKLGLDTQTLKGLSLDQQYIAVAEAISQVSNLNEQASISMKLFGKNGAEQLNVIRAGVKGLISEYDSLGIALSQSQIDAASALSDAKKQFGATFSSVSNSLISDMAPALTIILSSLSKMLLLLKDISSAAKDVGGAIKEDADSALNRLAMVGRFIGNAASGNGFTVDPSIIGTTQGETGPAGTQTPISSSIASVGAPGTIRELTPILTSLVPAFDALGTSVQRLDNMISDTLLANDKAATKDRLSEILGQRLQAGGGKQTYKDAGFEDLFRKTFDQIQQGGTNKYNLEYINQQIAALETRSRMNNGGAFSNQANIGAVAELKAFFAQQTAQIPKKQQVEVTVTPTKYFTVEIAHSKEVSTVIGDSTRALMAQEAAGMK